MIETVVIGIGLVGLTIICTYRSYLRHKTRMQEHKIWTERNIKYLRDDKKARIAFEKRKRKAAQERAEREAREGKEPDFMPIIKTLSTLKGKGA